jgi:hypothetical protein
MKILKIKECGYNEAVLGFSLSYNTSIERTEQILPKYAFGIPGESKFLEQIVIWLDVEAPRFYWQEADTYRVGCSKQSESTMHTICKKPLSNYNFEYPVLGDMIDDLNSWIELYKNSTKEQKQAIFLVIKNNLPEGFLQRRIWMMNYKTLQNIYNQRKNHKLPQWQYFLNTVLEQIEHPEFIKQGDYKKQNE